MTQAPVPLKIIQSNLEFNEICLHYGPKKTDPITNEFCTFQDSIAILECAEYLCDQIHVREVINKRILIKFEINLFSGMSRFTMPYDITMPYWVETAHSQHTFSNTLISPNTFWCRCHLKLLISDKDVAQIVYKSANLYQTFVVYKELSVSCPFACSWWLGSFICTHNWMSFLHCDLSWGLFTESMTRIGSMVECRSSMWLTYWSLGDSAIILNWSFSNLYQIAIKLPLNCHQVTAAKSSHP